MRSELPAPSASICLCTYDGERFLPGLLGSLVSQTRPPAEVIVGDDGSADRTLQIIDDFARTAPFPVRVAPTAPARLGPARNLERLLEVATGDLLFPCDQDDIWHAERVATVSDALAGEPDRLAAVNDSAFIDDTGGELAGSLFATMKLTPERRRQIESGRGFTTIARQNIVASHALCLRREALNLVLPFPDIRHGDWWMALLLAGTSGISILDTALVDYRQHERNAVGVSLTIVERTFDDATEVFADRAHMLDCAIERLSSRAPDSLSISDREEVGRQVEYLRTRASMSSSRLRRLRAIARQLKAGDYSRYGSGWRTAAADLARPPASSR